MSMHFGFVLFCYMLCFAFVAWTHFGRFYGWNTESEHGHCFVEYLLVNNVRWHHHDGTNEWDGIVDRDFCKRPTPMPIAQQWLLASLKLHLQIDHWNLLNQFNVNFIVHFFVTPFFLSFNEFRWKWQQIFFFFAALIETQIKCC